MNLQLSIYSPQSGPCPSLSWVAFAALVVFPAALCAGQQEAPLSPGSQPAAVQTAAAPAETAAKPEDTPKVEAPPRAEPAPKGAAAPKGIGPDSTKRYVIGPLDVLSIKVWNQAQISGMVDVHPDGMISLPLVGEVKADGLTTSQLEQALTTRLNDILTSPEVNVSLVKNNSKHFQVYGGVLHGGEFPLIETTTIMDALALAGFKDFAKLTKIELRRGKETFHFNYKDFIKGKNMDNNPNLELRNGDQIIVPE